MRLKPAVDIETLSKTSPGVQNLLALFLIPFKTGERVCQVGEIMSQRLSSQNQTCEIDFVALNLQAEEQSNG